MIEINLRDILQKGQEYVAELGEELGIPMKVVKHDIETSTCYEKLDILGEGWTVDRIVKSVFFSGAGKIYGLIFPELGERENPECFSQKDLGAILGWGKKQTLNIRNSACPYGMEFGTCTPFVLDYSFDEDEAYPLPLEKIFIHDAPSIEDQIIDISIGGWGRDAHKTSIHLPYFGIYKILEKKFGDKIVKENILAS